MKTLGIAERYDMIDAIASKWTDNADVKEVLSYFFNAQFEYLSDLPEDELLAIAQEEGVAP